MRAGGTRTVTQRARTATCEGCVTDLSFRSPCVLRAHRAVGRVRARPNVAMAKKGGKKKKGKVEYLTTPEALAPFGVSLRDLVATPLGVQVC